MAIGLSLFFFYTQLKLIIEQDYNLTTEQFVIEVDKVDAIKTVDSEKIQISTKVSWLYGDMSGQPVDRFLRVIYGAETAEWRDGTFMFTKDSSFAVKCMKSQFNVPDKIFKAYGIANNYCAPPEAKY